MVYRRQALPWLSLWDSAYMIWMTLSSDEATTVFAHNENAGGYRLSPNRQDLLSLPEQALGLPRTAVDPSYVAFQPILSDVGPTTRADNEWPCRSTSSTKGGYHTGAYSISTP